MRIPKRKPGKYADVRRDPHMTQAKFDELTAQLARLNRARPEAAHEVKRLAEMGDFSQRILEIADHLKHSQIIYPAPSRLIQLGSTVTIEQDGKQQTFKILGPTETHPAKGIISHKSPLGAALVGKQAGDTVHYNVSSGERRAHILRVA